MTPHPSRTETTLSLSSSVIENNAPVPKKYTGDGDDVSPPLAISKLPDETQSIVIIMDDPDAPDGTFAHWLVWDLPPEVREIPEGADITALGGFEGTNDFNRTGYGGPAPPPGNAHRYYFRVYALRDPVELPTGTGRGELEDAIRGKTIASGELMGTYQRTS